MLRPAIAQLERFGYLKAMDNERRFVRLARGRRLILRRHVTNRTSSVRTGSGRRK
jgi:hypothetical protein